MNKIVIDISIIDSDYNKFLEIARENIIVLTNRTYRELEKMLVNKNCTDKNKIFAKNIIRYCAEKVMIDSKEVILVKLEDNQNYLDHEIVSWAKENDTMVYTGDYGMFLDCKFEDVKVIFAGHISNINLQFVCVNDMGMLQVDLHKVPYGQRILVLDNLKNQFKSVGLNEKILLNNADKILTCKASEECTECCKITTYIVNLKTQSVIQDKEESFALSEIEKISDYNKKKLIEKWKEINN